VQRRQLLKTEVDRLKKELREAYTIAARHEDRWSSAFTSLLRGLLTEDVIKKLRKALREETPESAVRAMPWYNPGDPESEKLWSKLADKLKSAYADVIEETSQDEFDRLKIKKKIKLFKQETLTHVFGIRWLEKRIRELIPELSNAAQETILQIIRRGFERGLRGEALLKEILKPGRLGLLPREERAVQKRFDLMIEQGLPLAKANKAADKYAKKLLRKRAKRIARTELVTAQARGRLDAWRLAQEAGDLPVEVEREWVAATASERTCPICLELDGQRAKLGEPYDSAVLGRTVEHPGMFTHPQCRCVEILRRVGE